MNEAVQLNDGKAYELLSEAEKNAGRLCRTIAMLLFSIGVKKLSIVHNDIVFGQLASGRKFSLQVEVYTPDVDDDGLKENDVEENPPDEEEPEPEPDPVMRTLALLLASTIGVQVVTVGTDEVGSKIIKGRLSGIGCFEIAF